MDKKIYYFTFGAGQSSEGLCQPIKAESMSIAREKMFEMYGDKWSFAYTAEQWEDNKLNPNFNSEVELSIIEI